MTQPSTPANPLATKLIPASEVARSLGYRDIRHFRMEVAPRIGLPLLRVGLRWFVDEQEYARVLRAVTAPAAVG